MKIQFKFAMLLALTGYLLTAHAVESAGSYELSIREHQFQPAEMVIPAGEKVRLVIKNEDSTPEEFESRSLKREKIIPGKSQVVLPVGPLSPGTYEFFGEFHESTAKGRIIVK